MVIHIFIPGNPPTRTAQQKGVSARNGYVHFYEKASVRQAKDELAWKIKPSAPAEPIHGAVTLTIRWGFELKRVKKPGYKTTRPDLDNLEKGLIDVMTKLGFWDDDSQIVIKKTMKYEVPVGEGFLEITVEDLKHD